MSDAATITSDPVAESLLALRATGEPFIGDVYASCPGRWCAVKSLRLVVDERRGLTLGSIRCPQCRRYLRVDRVQTREDSRAAFAADCAREIVLRFGTGSFAP